MGEANINHSQHLQHQPLLQEEPSDSVSTFPTSHYGLSKFLSCLLTPVLVGHFLLGGLGIMCLSPCAPRLSCCPPAGRDTATLILTMELPEENVAAPVAAQQVAKCTGWSVCHTRHCVICHPCCRVTAGLSLILILFNESKWTLNLQMNDFRQGKVDAWLSLAEQLCVLRLR